MIARALLVLALASAPSVTSAQLITDEEQALIDEYKGYLSDAKEKIDELKDAAPAGWTDALDETSTYLGKATDTLDAGMKVVDYGNLALRLQAAAQCIDQAKDCILESSCKRGYARGAEHLFNGVAGLMDKAPKKTLPGMVMYVAGVTLSESTKLIEKIEQASQLCGTDPTRCEELCATASSTPGNDVFCPSNEPMPERCEFLEQEFGSEKKTAEKVKRGEIVLEDLVVAKIRASYKAGAREHIPEIESRYSLVQTRKAAFDDAWFRSFFGGADAERAALADAVCRAQWYLAFLQGSHEIDDFEPDIALLEKIAHCPDYAYMSTPGDLVWRYVSDKYR